MTTDYLDFTWDGVTVDLVITVPNADGSGVATAVSGTVGGAAIISIDPGLYSADDSVSPDAPYLDTEIAQPVFCKSC